VGQGFSGWEEPDLEKREREGGEEKRKMPNKPAEGKSSHRGTQEYAERGENKIDKELREKAKHRITSDER